MLYICILPVPLLTTGMMKAHTGAPPSYIPLVPLPPQPTKMPIKPRKHPVWRPPISTRVPYDCIVLIEPDIEPNYLSEKTMDMIQLIVQYGVDDFWLIYNGIHKVYHKKKKYDHAHMFLYSFKIKPSALSLWEMRLKSDPFVMRYSVNKEITLRQKSFRHASSVLATPVKSKWELYNELPFGYPLVWPPEYNLTYDPHLLAESDWRSGRPRHFTPKIRHTHTTTPSPFI